MGYDPARSETGEEPRFNKRLDLPPEAYMKVRLFQMHSLVLSSVLTPRQDPMDSRFAKRPNYNEVGKKVSIEVNQYAVVKRKENFKVFQYDVRFLSVHLQRLCLIHR